MADRRNTPWDSVAERVAELLKHQLNKPSDQAEQQEKLGEALERLIAQQQQTNDHLQRLQSGTEAQTQEFRNWQETTHRSASKVFLRKMALEIPPVVIAVLLAFGINSWWQNLKQRRLTNIARENIIQEIRSNYVTLEQNIKDNKERIAEINRALNSSSLDSASSVVRGMQMYTITEAAWDAASSVGTLPNLDQEFIIEASKIYNLQITRESNLESYVGSLTNVLSYVPENLRYALKQNQVILGDLVNNDEFLLRLYKDFLEKYAEEKVIISSNE